MDKLFSRRNLLIAALLPIAIVVCAPLSSSAQTAPSNPQILLTWKAGTYVPPGFTGKIFPTVNSVIIASAELIDNGKIVNTSKQNVYWYQNNNFIDGGIGMQTISFQAPQVSGGPISLRVEFPDYSKGDELKTVDVQIVGPKIVIEAPFPAGNFSSSPLKLTAQPYFFNVSNPAALNFAWNANGQAPSGAENPQSLNISFDQALQSQSTISISVSAQNIDSKKYPLEAASDNISLTYSP